MHICPQHKSTWFALQILVSTRSPQERSFCTQTKAFDSLFAINFPTKQLHLNRDALESYLRILFPCKIHFLPTHFSTACRLSWKFQKVFPKNNKFKSFAKRKSSARKSTSGRSFKKQNSRGTKIEPCGTPLVTSITSENTSFTRTNYFLSLR